MATLQPNSQTLHQTEPKIHKLHAPVPLSTHKCQIKMTPEPRQPQIPLVDTRHQHWIRITKRTQPEARNSPNYKPHYRSPRMPRRNSTRAHLPQVPLINACQHQHWDGHIPTEFTESQKRTQTERPKLQNLVSSSMHTPRQTMPPQPGFSKAYLLRDAVRVRMGKLESFRGCRKNRCWRYP